MATDTGYLCSPQALEAMVSFPSALGRGLMNRHLQEFGSSASFPGRQTAEASEYCCPMRAEGPSTESNCLIAGACSSSEQNWRAAEALHMGLPVQEPRTQVKWLGTLNIQVPVAAVASAAAAESAMAELLLPLTEHF